MKRYTQEEFDALPVVDGHRRCPTGDYTQVNSFGEGCSLGVGCRFEGGHKVKPGYPLLAIAGAGSTHRTTYFFNTKDGIIVRSGCFKGTLDEFRKKVRKDGPDDSVKSMQYLGFANIVAATWAPELIER